MSSEISATPSAVPAVPLSEEMRRAALFLIGRGDQAALAALYDDLAPAAYRLVSLSLQDPARVAAAVRQAFVDLWTVAPDPSATADLPVEAWVLATAHRRGRELRGDALPTSAPADGPMGMGGGAGRR